MKSHWFALMVLFFLGMLGQAQNYLEDARVFPEKTLVFVSVSFETDMKTQWKKTPLGRILEEPEVQDFLVDIEEKYQWKKNTKKFCNHFASVFGMEIQEIANITQNISVAFIDIPQGSEPIALGMVIRFSPEKKAEADKLIQRSLEVLPINQSTYVYGKYTVNQWKGLENTIHYIELSDRFLVATTKELISQMADRLKKIDGSLGNSPNFKEFTSKIPANPFILAYINTDETLEQIWGYISEEERNALSALQIREWKNLGLTFSFNEQGFFTYLTLQLKSEPKGIHVFLPSEVLKLNTDWIPQGSGAGILTNIAFAQIWKEFQTCFQKLEPKAFKAFQKDLAKFEKAFLDARIAEIAENLGPELAFFHIPNQYQGAIPQTVLIISIKKEDLMHKTMNNIAAMLQYQFKKKTYKERTFFYLAPQEKDSHSEYKERAVFHLNEEERIALRALMGTLSYYTEQDKVVIATMPQTIMDYMDYGTSEKLSLKLDSVKPLPGNSYTTLMYFDIRQFLPLYYQTLLRLLPIAEEFRGIIPFFSFDSAFIPRIGTIARHLSPFKAGIAREKQSFSCTLRSNMGLEFFVPTLVSILAIDFYMGNPLTGFYSEFENFLDVYEIADKLEKEGRYYQASQKWKDLSSWTKFEYFRRVAEENKRKLVTKYENQVVQFQKKIEELTDGKFFGKWQVHGDWTCGKESIFAKSEEETFLLISTKQPLSQYVLHMEVKDIENRFAVLCHWQLPEEKYATKTPWQQSTRYQSLYFQENKNAKGVWVPLRIKVKGEFISYWYGIHHHNIRSSYDNGCIGIMVPAGSSVEIRNIRLTEVEIPEKPAQTMAESFPSLHISCNDNVDPVSPNENVTYLLTLINKGQSPAKDVKIVAMFSETLRWKETSGNPYIKWSSKGNIVQSSAFSLGTGEKLQLRFTAIAIKPEVGYIQLAVSFAGMQGEIVVTEYTLIR